MGSCSKQSLKNLSYSKSILLTSLGEKRTLKKTFVNTAGIKKKIVRYGIIKPKINKKKILKKFFTKFPMLKNKEFYLFLGRFHEKKGCEIIIESVKKIENNFKSIILFVGPMTKNIYEIKIMNLIMKENFPKENGKSKTTKFALNMMTSGAMNALNFIKE